MRVCDLGQTEDACKALEAIVVPTCGRPTMLARCLDGMLKNLSTYGHSPEIIVSDASRDPLAVQNNQFVVGALKCDRLMNVTMLGMETRHHVSRQLEVAGFDKDVISFALDGVPDLRIGCAGANRNLLLLKTAGRKFVSVDDDVEFQFVSPSQISSSDICEENIMSVNGNFGIQHWMFADRDSLLSSAVFDNLDFFGSHLAILGRNISEFDAISQAHRLSKPADRSAKIGVTLNGVIGDCGWGSPSPYLFMDEPSLRRLTRSSESYQCGVTSREIARMAASFCVTDRVDNLISTTFGGDGNIAFVPFFPAGRGEDVLFGQMLKKTDPSIWFSHLPFAILHSPIEKRRFWDGEILRNAATTDLSSTFCRMIDSIILDSNSDVPALVQMGRVLITLGELPAGAFHDYLRQHKMTESRNIINLLEKQLAFSASSSASNYTSDVQAYIHRIIEGDSRQQAGIPAELLYRYDQQEALNQARKLTLLYGRLLCSWPDMIHTAAKYLR